MINRNILCLLLLISTIATAQSVQSPEEFLGYEIGTQFSRHADVVQYYEHVARNSDWVTYQTYGKTNERRPLTYAIVSSPENIKNIESIRNNHLNYSGLGTGSSSTDKAIVWLSYNVHGNEASSTEASMATLYELITTKKDWLQNTVVIIDPCLNPDGRDRYVNWYNSVKATPYDESQSAAEHHEPWPGGRPNHYLFDLNRDWAWATQVESRQRLKVYNKWMPHVHVDFHEQGINEPYYFAPAAEPFHEVITDFQRDFQTEIGKNNAKYFDQEGWLFFTRERFDLLYPSYGDTYPTYMGAIGMTYEQAGHGRAGLGIETDEGYVLTLVDRVAHHKTTGLSTVEVAANNVERLTSQFKTYFQENDTEYKSYVIKGHDDKLNQLADLLDLHGISYGYVTNGKVSGFSSTENGQGSMNYEKALVVDADQPRGRMVKVLFEPDASLSTPITYDITAWNLVQAYGLEAVATTSRIKNVQPRESIEVQHSLNPNAAGYITKWNSLADAKFLADLLQNDIKVRFTEKPFINGNTEYGRGSLIITKSDNKNNAQLVDKLSALAEKHNRNLVATATSFATAGPDFGSPDVKLVNNQRIGVLKGEGTSSLSYGSIWYFFEQELNYPLTSINTDYFDNVDLDQFDVLILPNGYYGRLLDDKILESLTTWMRSGGKVIAIGNAVSSFEGKNGFGIKSNAADKDTKNGNGENDENTTAEDLLIPYADREAENVKDLITGSIFKIKIDATHPMAFGYGDEYHTLKLGDASYSFLEDGYNVGYIKDEPVKVSGFAGERAMGALDNSLIFGEQRLGSGGIVYMVDDPLFRAFWQNGKLFFVNSLFFVNNNAFRL